MHINLATPDNEDFTFVFLKSNSSRNQCLIGMQCKHKLTNKTIQVLHKQHNSIAGKVFLPNAAALPERSAKFLSLLSPRS